MPAPLWLLLLLTLSRRGLAADWRVEPTLLLRETYSDNIHLAPQAAARSDLVSEVSPGISVTGQGARLTLHLAYNLQHLRYRHEAPSTRSQLQAGGHAEIAENWFYADARASISQQSVSAFGAQAFGPEQRSANQNTVRTTNFSPYLKHRFARLATAELRYSRDTVRSDGDLLSVNSAALQAQLTSDSSGSDWNWQLDHRAETIDDARQPRIHTSRSAASLRYALSSKITVFGSAGRENLGYASSTGQIPVDHFWSLGAGWYPSRRSSLVLSGGKRYFGNTYSLDAGHRSRAAIWTLSYKEDITSTHAELARLSQGATAGLLDQLWRSAIPDAQRRQQDIATFLLVSQLLGDSAAVNYFSHNYYLQQQWQFSMATVGHKSVLAMNAAVTRRTVQSNSGAESLLLAPVEITLQDRTRQRTANGAWSLPLSPRSQFRLGVAYAGVTSLSTGRDDRNVAVTAGFSRTLQANLTGALDLRRISHHSNAGGDYRENAITATLKLSF